MHKNKPKLLKVSAYLILYLNFISYYFVLFHMITKNYSVVLLATTSVATANATLSDSAAASAVL